MYVADYAGASEFKTRIQHVKDALRRAQGDLNKTFEGYQNEHGEGVEYQIDDDYYPKIEKATNAV